MYVCVPLCATVAHTALGSDTRESHISCARLEKATSAGRSAMVEHVFTSPNFSNVLALGRNAFGGYESEKEFKTVVAVKK